MAMHALASANTVMLPDTAFVKRGKDGLLRKMMMRFTLTERNREVVKIPGKRFKDEHDQWQTADATYDLSAVGYRRLNQMAGLHCITPEYVVVAGKRQPNPYIQEDERSKRPQRVYVRRVVIGPARDTGNLVATDIMLVLDLELYILENLLKKLNYAGKPPWKGKGAKQDDDTDATAASKASSLGQWGTADEKPKDAGTWRFYAIHGDVGVWFNLLHPEFQKAMGEHVQRCKFADRIAQSLAERNAMKAHPGMPASISVDETGQIRVPMVGWTSQITAEQLNGFREMVNAGNLDEEMEVRSAEVKADQDTDLVEAERVATEEDSNQTVDEAEEGEEKPTETPAPKGPPAADENPEPADRQKLLEQANEVYQELAESMGKKKLAEAMAKIGIKGGPDTATDAQLKEVIGLKKG